MQSWITINRFMKLHNPVAGDQIIANYCVSSMLPIYWSTNWTRRVDGTPTWSHPVKSLVNTMCMVKGLGHIWPWKFKDQGHCQGQTWWSHLRRKVQSICILLVSWQSDHFWLIYSKFHIWPSKIKIKVMAKVKPDGHIWIWGPEFNRYVCSLFRGNQTIFGWYITNSIFDLENSRSRSRPKSTKI